ncbi:MAG TPA: hypothetical protein VJY33_08225, partial [Isosphaeraceae bacterium]|nr:hypothetical protein [Isosphaeraceae bacterium]
EKATIRDTLEGAGEGAAEGAAVGSFGGPVGTVGGAISGGVGGAVEGFGQGIYDSNKAYFEARDPGRNLPNSAKPSTDLRVGYQAGLAAAASAAVGDYAADSIMTSSIGVPLMNDAINASPFPYDPGPQGPQYQPQLTPIDVGKSGLSGGAIGVALKDPALLRQQKSGEPIEPVFIRNVPIQVNAHLGSFFGGYGSSAPWYNGPVVNPGSFTPNPSPSPTPQYPPIYFPLMPPGREDWDFGGGASQASDTTATY